VTNIRGCRTAGNTCTLQNHSHRTRYSHTATVPNPCTLSYLSARMLPPARLALVLVQHRQEWFTYGCSKSAETPISHRHNPVSNPAHQPTTQKSHLQNKKSHTRSQLQPHTLVPVCQKAATCPPSPGAAPAPCVCMYVLTTSIGIDTSTDATPAAAPIARSHACRHNHTAQHSTVHHITPYHGAPKHDQEQAQATCTHADTCGA
jgi:hypothetical protein